MFWLGYFLGKGKASGSSPIGGAFKGVLFIMLLVLLGSPGVLPTIVVWGLRLLLLVVLYFVGCILWGAWAAFKE
ncbi:hypothetical protein [Vagococcus xieshaowenii]|uniref:Uncharacterized protein n=1 Tax=Vagococcus xieshaowenii TaxID=2562451 RepID=A0AAJ5EGR7_9ENTE|nr:hypothetical protein [Vagococcus xieshaowenii]QCA29706.1 hypothetical protein E4Z98_09985 [Vagococcus xieshaowenii]TFZ42921.1 hypothetical protein E4031_01420 [Vagococcus xieshaowenii]